MGYLRLELCRADENDHDAIVGLIDAAARWLRRTKDTDQWAQPWRSQEDRSNRIRRDLTAGKTWLLRNSGIAVATITADPQDYPIWPAERQREPAVYVRRLVVGRDHACRWLGSALLDWAWPGRAAQLRSPVDQGGRLAHQQGTAGVLRAPGFRVLRHVHRSWLPVGRAVPEAHRASAGTLASPVSRRVTGAAGGRRGGPGAAAPRACGAAGRGRRRGGGGSPGAWHGGPRRVAGPPSG